MVLWAKIDDVTLTYQDMCNKGTGAQCRSYFVVLTLHEYATHAIYDNDKQRWYMYQDYISHHNAQSIEVAHMLMLQDLERLFCRSQSLLSKVGFPKQDGVPTELEEAISTWLHPDEIKRQVRLLESLNLNQPNNEEQQNAYNEIMNSIGEFANVKRESLTSHLFHFIGGPGGTGKFALFRKLHASCCSKGFLITICMATSLAALSFEGAVTAHSSFGYPVEDEEDVDDINPTRCEINNE
jgi:hypothetical protein